MSKIVLFALSFLILVCNTNKIVAQNSDDRNKLVAIAAIAPAYSPQAVASKVEGDVFVDVKIDDTGKVIKATFAKGSELLKKSVIDAALKWKFNQAKVKGKIRKARITFTFSLNNNDYEKPNLDEIRYKYRVKIYYSATSDCFNMFLNPPKMAIAIVGNKAIVEFKMNTSK